MSSLAAVILAGGRARRLGGRDKPSIEVNGRSLLDHVIAGAQEANCEQIIVVGPATLARPGVTLVREDPPFAGPAAALLAGLEPVQSADVLLLAADLVHGEQVVALLAALPTAGAGVCLVDEGGQRQWLASRWPAELLRAALGQFPGVRDAALREVLGAVPRRDHVVDGDLVRDIDTPEDLEEIWQRTRS